MAAPTKVYAQLWEVWFTAEQAEAIRTEAALRGLTASAVIRESVAVRYAETRGEAS